MSQQTPAQPDPDKPQGELLSDDDFLAALNEVAEMEESGKTAARDAGDASSNAPADPPSTENPASGTEDDLDALLADGSAVAELPEAPEAEVRASDAPEASEAESAVPETPPEPQAVEPEEEAPAPPVTLTTTQLTIPSADPEPEQEPEPEAAAEPEPAAPVEAEPAAEADPEPEAPAEPQPEPPEPVAAEPEPESAPDADAPTSQQPQDNAEPQPGEDSKPGEEPQGSAEGSESASGDGEDAAVSDDELLAALQQVESDSIADPFGGGDDLSNAFADANFDDAAAPMGPEDGEPSDENAEPSDEASEASDPDKPEILPSPPAGAKADAKPGKVPAGMSFKLGAKTVGGPPPPPPAPEERPASKPGRALLPVASIGKRIYRTADGALDLLHRPFSGLSGKVRMLIGYCAMTTIAVSAVSVLVIPMLVQRRDAVAFLLEKRAEMEADKQAKPVVSEEAVEE